VNLSRAEQQGAARMGFFLSILIQLAVVILGSATCSYIAIYFGHGSVLNLVWLLGVPIGVAFVANKSPLRRIAMSIALMICSLLIFAEMIVATGCC
jgi:hypothetical protein